MKKLIVAGVVCVAAAGALMIPIGGGSAASEGGDRVTRMDLSPWSDAKPDRALNVLVIHHSCGGQMLADPGQEAPLGKTERENLWKAHPNGGGGRAALTGAGYVLNEASYDSEIGEKTDLFDWLPKFTGKMDRVLHTKMQDEQLPAGQQNDVVIFKSCFPNNEFVGEGSAPGNPNGPELTVANAKATLAALLPEFQKHPETLFVFMTSPPNAGAVPKERAWKWVARRVLGRPGEAEARAEQARLARQFANWAVATDGWLKDYPLKNVVAFDYYDVLTDAGVSNLSRYPTEDGWDSHPNTQGNAKVAGALIPFLNRAVRRWQEATTPRSASPAAISTGQPPPPR